MLSIWLTLCHSQFKHQYSPVTSIEQCTRSGSSTHMPVILNDDTAFRIDGMPFAGLRQSGLGTRGIKRWIQEMTIDKMLVIHSTKPVTRQRRR